MNNVYDKQKKFDDMIKEQNKNTDFEKHKKNLVEGAGRKFMYAKTGLPYELFEKCEHEICNGSHCPDKIGVFIAEKMMPTDEDIADGMSNISSVGCLGPIYNKIMNKKSI